MTSDQNPTAEAHVERTVSYVPPEVVDYGDAASITKTLALSSGNDGGGTPPNVYTS
jgi:hypothetical protein